MHATARLPRLPVDACGSGDECRLAVRTQLHRQSDTGRNMHAHSCVQWRQRCSRKMLSTNMHVHRSKSNHQPRKHAKRSHSCRSHQFPALQLCRSKSHHQNNNNMLWKIDRQRNHRADCGGNHVTAYSCLYVNTFAKQWSGVLANTLLTALASSHH